MSANWPPCLKSNQLKVYNNMINKSVVVGLTLLSLYFSYSGLSNFVNAEENSQRFGLALASESGLVSFRVAYGGMMIGIGITLLIAAWNKTMRLFGLYLSGIVLISFLVARFFAMLAMTRFDAYQAGLLVAESVEVFIVSVLIYAYRRMLQLTNADQMHVGVVYACARHRR